MHDGGRWDGGRGRRLRKRHDRRVRQRPVRLGRPGDQESSGRADDQRQGGSPDHLPATANNRRHLRLWRLRGWCRTQKLPTREADGPASHQHDSSNGLPARTVVEVNLISNTRADDETYRCGRREDEALRCPSAKTSNAGDHHDDRKDEVGDRHASAATDEFALELPDDTRTRSSTAASWGGRCGKGYVEGVLTRPQGGPLVRSFR